MLRKHNSFMIVVLIVSTYSSYAADTPSGSDCNEILLKNNFVSECEKLPSFRDYFEIGSVNKSMDEVIFWKYAPRHNHPMITYALLKGQKLYIDTVKQVLSALNKSLFDKEGTPETGCFCTIEDSSDQDRFDYWDNTLDRVIQQAFKAYIDVQDNDVYRDRLSEED